MPAPSARVKSLRVSCFIHPPLQLESRGRPNTAIDCGTLMRKLRHVKRAFFILVICVSSVRSEWQVICPLKGSLDLRPSGDKRQDAKKLRGCLGAGDENAREDFAGHGKEVHVGAGPLTLVRQFFPTILQQEVLVQFDVAAGLLRHQSSYLNVRWRGKPAATSAN